MLTKKIAGLRVAQTSMCVALFVVTSLSCFAQTNEFLNPKNWIGGAVSNQAMRPNPQGIVAEQNGLRFAGFHLGKEAQYSLVNELSKTLENKLITVTFALNGEFVGADSSFISLALRASSPLTIFWSQQCYALNFKRAQIEVQKLGKGNNPMLVYKYSDFPALGFAAFPVGKPVKASFGIIKDGAFPRMVVKLNGVDICNVLDNRYGQTVKAMPNNVFIIGVIATNKEQPGNGDSKSSIFVSDFKAE